MRLLASYSILTSLEKRLFFKAVLLIWWTRLVILIMPFKWYVKWLGKKDKETPVTPLKEFEKYVLLIKDTIRRASKYGVFRTKCLAEAIVAKRFLHKKNIPSTLYLGVAKNKNRKMTAHAWLRCGDIIVTGKKGMEKFTVVSFFT